ncbi:MULTISPECIES: hypothetical protein [unclassified Micromonospora]|uniref:hypothetical protein n=1 Tax=unclassified Micromonospora TaxID=2617518 RepID=UPI00188F8D72|nr:MULTISPECIES: hypothetical protein [unclassified Micromonospora]MBF5032271.1 hypothetical protein [Micromonospora sp. ANENR4]WBC02805.1 hypothetical protein O7546_27450 [Micromonospora sp. WMMA1976]
MPGSTPHAAFSAFVTPMTDALNCVVHPRLAVSPGGQTLINQKHNLYLTGHQRETDGFLRLPRTDLEFRARMFYMIIEDPREDYGPYRVTTRGYDYSVRKTDGAAVIDYHWHPVGLSHEKRPHIHLGSSQLRPDAVLSNKQHILSGRVTLESVVRDLIGLGVPPRFEDYAALLDLCEAPHLLHRTWTNDYEQETGQSIPE